MAILTTLKQMSLYPVRLIQGRTSKSKGSIDDIEPGEGSVLELDGRKVAVYKDENGNITKLSPTCTHLGCTVAWSKVDGEWVCPCHASHFAKDGKVLKGPAKRDLQQIHKE